MASKRTIITLAEEDKIWLEKYSGLHHVSMAHAVREGIRKLKDAESQKTYESLVKKTSGVWRGDDGLKYQKKLRSEWQG